MDNGKYLSLFKRARAVPGVESFVITITPKDAEELLSIDTHNRSASPLTVTKYANEMKDGAWILTGDTINICSDGILGNGAHRLRAIIESNTCQQFVVVYGLPPMSRQATDRGRARSMKDIIEIAGPSMPTISASVARNIARRNGNWQSWASIQDSTLMATVQSHESSIKTVCELIGGKKRGFSAPFVAACVLYYEIDRLKATDFIKKTTSGAGCSDTDDPCLRIRNYLLSGSAPGGSTGQTEIMQRVFYAMCAHLHGKKIPRVLLSSEIK